MGQDEVRALLREVSEAIAEVSRMIDENKSVQENLENEAEERRRRRAEIEAQHVRTDELLDRLNRALSPMPPKKNFSREPKDTWRRVPPGSS